MLGLIKRVFKRANKSYISDADVFLAKARRAAPLSTSQRCEIEKNARIANLRDNPERDNKKDKLWQGF